TALSGITAAVVGVILNLAMIFGVAVIFPAGWGHPPDWFALGLTTAAFAALSVFEIDELWVVLAGGGLGVGEKPLVLGPEASACGSPGARKPDAELQVAEGHDVPVLELPRRRDPLAADERSVSAQEILQDNTILTDVEDRVAPGDRRGIENDGRRRDAADV